MVLRMVISINFYTTLQLELLVHLRFFILQDCKQKSNEVALPFLVNFVLPFRVYFSLRFQFVVSFLMKENIELLFSIR